MSEQGYVWMKKMLHMKKRRLFSLFMVICFIVGIGISVYDVSMKKCSNWMNFIVLFQGVALPDKADVIKVDIHDRIGTPFSFALTYRSRNDMEKELERYRPMLEREHFVMEKGDAQQYVFHAPNHLLHFYLSRKDDTYRMEISNGGY